MQLARIHAIAHTICMNDQPNAPPQKRRPPSNEARPRRPRPPEPTSRESRFIGYLVLGFGILAVIAVLILAFSGSGEEGETADAPQPVQAQELVTALSQQSVAVPAPEPVKDLFFERDADFDAGRMEGDWQAQIGEYTAVLQIRKDVYQIILANNDPNSSRFYSSGTYKVYEDIILLNPRLDWPPPAVPKGKTINYAPMTRAAFPMIAKYEGGKMLWQNVPQAEKRVVAPYTSPLFGTENVKVASWKKL